MTIFADQCVHRDVIAALRQAGFNTTSAQDAGLHSATDSAIYDYALKKRCILLTFDKDFGNILRFEIPQSCGVVIIYIEDMDKEEIIKHTLGVFNNFSEAQFKGRLFIVEKDRIRTWPKQ